MGKRPFYVLVMFLGLVWACQPIPHNESPTATVSAVHETRPPNTPIPTSSATPIDNDTATEFGLLPTTESDVSRLRRVTNFAITNFYLRESLDEWQAGIYNIDFEIQIKTIDLDGEGEPEHVVAIEASPSSTSYHESAVWVITTRGNNLRIGLRLFGGYYSWSPEIFGGVDMTGDDLPDIIVQLTFGGSKCEENFAVISVVNGMIRDIFEDYSAWSCKSYARIGSDQQGDEYWLEIIGEPLRQDLFASDEVFDGVRFYFSGQEPHIEYESFRFD